MTRSFNQNELGGFLKARRAELSPALVGLPEDGQRRRVHGLRREEVALLAAISIDYYTRLEQGRIQASAAVLAELARVLQLSEDQKAYLSALAGKSVLGPRRVRRQEVQPQLRRLLDDLTTTPAFVLGHRTDILGWNPIATALFTDFGQVPEKHRTFVRLLFTDPAMRELYTEWEEVARLAVAQLRMDSARYPADPQLASLVGELSIQDAQFRQWWAARHVAARGMGTKKLRHPIVGDLTLDWDTMSGNEAPQKLALEFGATDIVAERGDEGVARVKELTSGIGADSVLECVGTHEAMQQALHSARPGGNVGFVGVPHDVNIPAEELFFSHVGLRGGPAPVRRFLPDLIERVWNGRINPGRVFDLTLPLDRAAEAYQAMDERRAIKALLLP